MNITAKELCTVGHLKVSVLLCAVSMYTLRLLCTCTRFEWTNVASALNRSDASSWELRVVVSLGAPSSAHSLRSVRHSSGPSAHYNT